jgi:hypothetical protein
LRLYLGVAVGAQEDALGGLGSRLGERAAQAALAEREALVGRGDVVEGERGQTPVVAAAAAATARLATRTLFTRRRRRTTASLLQRVHL